MNKKSAVKEKANDTQKKIREKSTNILENNTILAIPDSFEDAGILDDKKVIDRIGQLTRTLHDSLRELGYDKRLQTLAAEAPEAQDKLTYVATKTEQAAERTLNATEIAIPIQEKLSADALHLSEQWKSALENSKHHIDNEKFKFLLIDTLQYLDGVSTQTSATNSQLMEIMMAQDFQDLTGQVIKKITLMVQNLEKDLIEILLASVPAKKNHDMNEGFLNGPVINPEKCSDVVCNQDQVDDLLASLGF